MVLHDHSNATHTAIVYRKKWWECEKWKENYSISNELSFKKCDDDDDEDVENKIEKENEEEKRCCIKLSWFNSLTD